MVDTGQRRKDRLARVGNAHGRVAAAAIIKGERAVVPDRKDGLEQGFEVVGGVDGRADRGRGE